MARGDRNERTILVILVKDDPIIRLPVTRRKNSAEVNGRRRNVLLTMSGIFSKQTESNNERNAVITKKQKNKKWSG